MKAYLVVENFSAEQEPMSGYRGTIFFDKKNAERRYGVYRRNENVRILEIDIQIPKGVEQE